MSLRDRKLFAIAPRLESVAPWVELARLPTPLERLTLHTADGTALQAAIKRDDLSGELYGGNKVRKLEFLLGGLAAENCTHVVTAGAYGSHHVLATALYARALGMDVTAVLFPQRITPHVRDILLMIAASGARIRHTARMEFVPVALRRARRAAGPRARIVPPGGSNDIGTLGYVECGLELAQQWRDRHIEPPDAIHVAAGTLGTAAGLALGLAIAETPVEIVATRITSPLVTNERALYRLVRRAAMLLERAGAHVPPIENATNRVRLDGTQIGAGYGHTTPQADAAARMFANAGLKLDTTYTAKAAAAFLADPRTARGRTLYLHTLSANEPVDHVAEVTDLPRPIAQRVARYSSEADSV